MYSSAKESRVPEVGGGPRTSIFTAGNALLTSFHVVYGFAIRDEGFAGSGTVLASARNTSFRVRFSEAPALLCASTMPSYPTLISTTSLTPFWEQVASSAGLMRREALA